MNNSKFFRLKKEFEKELTRKNSWGKNEIIRLFDEVLIKILTEDGE